MTAKALPGWHPDPFGRFQQRYWDGTAWTTHVATNGVPASDPVMPEAQSRPGTSHQTTSGAASAPAGTGRPARLDRAAARIRKQVERLDLSHTIGQPDMALLTEPILVVNQRGKLLELKAAFSVFDRHGTQVAAVRGKRLSTRMEVVDLNARSLLELRRESSVVRSRTVVADGDGTKIGEVVPSLGLKRGSRAFKLTNARGRAVGEVFTESLQHHRDFNVQDTTGSVAARINKTRSGWGKELFTKGDNYVLEFTESADQPLRLLGLAALLVIDRTYHQK